MKKRSQIKLKCEGCAHNHKRKSNEGCGILTERPPGPDCWARMTEEQLKKVEKEIDIYKYHVTGKGRRP